MIVRLSILPPGEWIPDLGVYLLYHEPTSVVKRLMSTA